MYPETSYALSKVVGEELARQFHRWSGIPIIGLRFSNVMVAIRLRAFRRPGRTILICASGTCGAMSTRATSPRVCGSPSAAESRGADNFIVAAGDTVMRAPSRELMAEVYPGVRVADGVSGNDTCSTSRARARSSATRRTSAGATSASSRLRPARRP